MDVEITVYWDSARIHSGSILVVYENRSSKSSIDIQSSLIIELTNNTTWWQYEWIACVT